MIMPFQMCRSLSKLAFVLGFAAFMCGCEVDKFGAPCDGFFSNGCKGAMTCMSDGKGKFCSQSCTINKAFPEMSDKCPTGSECVEAVYSKGSTSAPMGSMCARPK
jgi:hypothetical protein